jgi:hypothetical protein
VANASDHPLSSDESAGRQREDCWENVEGLGVLGVLGGNSLVELVKASQFACENFSLEQ